MPSTLRIGSHGPEVARMQELLNKHLQPSAALKVDGLFGPRTEAAVRRYQASVGIGIDGIVGLHTTGAMEQGLEPKEGRHKSIAIDFTRAPWVGIAMREMGQAQFRGEKQNPRILQYHASTILRATTDETAWCSSFINWCLHEAGIEGTRSAQATSWLHWGDICCPRAGAITVIRELDPPPSRSGYHVGIWIEDNGHHFKLLGGNQSKMVKISSYPRAGWNPIGHRWPFERGKK